MTENENWFRDALEGMLEEQRQVKRVLLAAVALQAQIAGVPLENVIARLEETENG